MPLETGTYIDDLNAANPAATDGLSQADDHIRLIKSVLKATFPNWTSALTATQAQVDAIAAAYTTGPFLVPSGGSAGSPMLAVVGDTDSGLWCIGANNLGIGVGGSKILDISSAGLNLTGDFIASGTVTAGGIWRTGDVKLTMQPTAESGWLVVADQTIGNTSSGATYANAAAEALYTLIYNQVSNTYAPVTGGRGANAAADWAAQKPMALTKMLGRALAIAGAGSGLTSRALGEILGAESKTLSTGNLPPHYHDVFLNDPGHTHPVQGGTFAEAAAALTFASTGFSGSQNTSSNTTGITVRSASGGGGTADRTHTEGSTMAATAFDLSQPSTFLRAHIKL